MLSTGYEGNPNILALPSGLVDTKYVEPYCVKQSVHGPKLFLVSGLFKKINSVIALV